jgi:outer membrane lipoprotein-sorting protein
VTVRALLLLASLAASACAARLPARPAGPDRPDPAAVDAFTRATRACAGLATLTAEVRLSGRAGGERLRGTLHAGLAAPAALRVEAVAPFGPPVFILAGRDDRATLLLPRDDRVLREAAVPQVLERLTGLALSAADLRLVLSGCLADPARPGDGRAFAGGWQTVTLASGIVAYLRDVDGVPIVVAADRGEWRIDYAQHQNGFPRQVRLRRDAGDVDLTAALSQLEINTPIDPRAFEVAVPADAVPMTLEQLRAVVPLRASQP